LIQHHDWLPTFLAAAGEPDIVDKLKQGHKAGDKEFKVHIDGYNLLPYLIGQADGSPRRGMVYFSDDGDVLGIRASNWKVMFMEQRCPGTMQVWAEPFTPLRLPKLYNLRTDPYERADITSNTYWDWVVSRGFLVIYAQAIVTQFLDTFKEFPPGSEQLHSPSIRRWKSSTHSSSPVATEPYIRADSRNRWVLRLFVSTTAKPRLIRGRHMRVSNYVSEMENYVSEMAQRMTDISEQA
jgi:hypothetical protein